MLFVIDNYFKGRRAKITAWERAGDAWIKKMDDASDYRTHDMDDYERVHPYPGFRLSGERVFACFMGLVIGIAVVALVGTIVSAVVDHKKDTANKPKTSTSQQKNKDYSPKVGDKVQVVYGDYKDSIGEIVKVKNDGVIIKLTKSSYTKAMASANNSSLGTDDGQLLDIASNDNIVPYQEAK